MNRPTPSRLVSRERFRHNHDQNQISNQHGKESSYRAQAEFDNSFVRSNLKPWESSSVADELTNEEQYRTDGEAHNYNGPIEDDRFGEYPRFGKNLNRKALSQRGFAGVGPKGYTRSDTRIEEEICEILARDKYIDASEIEVAVKDGIVTLSGEVDDREDRFDAEVLVERVLGVDDIKNDIKVKKSNAKNQYQKATLEFKH